MKIEDQLPDVSVFGVVGCHFCFRAIWDMDILYHPVISLIKLWICEKSEATAGGSSNDRANVRPNKHPIHQSQRSVFHAFSMFVLLLFFRCSPSGCCGRRVQGGQQRIRQLNLSKFGVFFPLIITDHYWYHTSSTLVVAGGSRCCWWDARRVLYGTWGTERAREHNNAKRLSCWVATVSNVIIPRESWDVESVLLTFHVFFFPFFVFQPVAFSCFWALCRFLFCPFAFHNLFSIQFSPLLFTTFPHRLFRDRGASLYLLRAALRRFFSRFKQKFFVSDAPTSMETKRNKDEDES